MKYFTLTQIAEFLRRFKKLTNARRIADKTLELSFDGRLNLAFDLSCGSIYKSDETTTKSYQAPFDTLLKKRLCSAQILNVSVPKNNRVLCITARFNGAYKSTLSTLVVEFTGRFTNAILLDGEFDGELNLGEIRVVDALRHYENSLRAIKPGALFTPLEPFEIREKESERVEDFEAFFEREKVRICEGRLQNLKDSKAANVEKKLSNLKALLGSLESDFELGKRAKEAEKSGKILTSHLWELKDDERNFTLDGENFSLTNPPKFAANEFFSNAKKLRQKAAGVNLQRENLLEKISFLERLKDAIACANTATELEALAPRKRTQRTQEKNRQNSSDFVEHFYMGEFRISVGKSEKGNEILLKESKKNDFWFHLKDQPSAHVIVKTAKANLSEEVAKFAATLCVRFSVTQKGTFLVDYTKRENVKVKERAFVNYVNFKTIQICV